jgi:hypothetical protein
MTWAQRFDEGIVLADGSRLHTLQHAANYIAALPKEQSDAADWKLALEALTLAAKRSDYVQLARAVMLKALEPPAPEPPPKSSPKLRIVR